MVTATSSGWWAPRDTHTARRQSLPGGTCRPPESAALPGPHGRSAASLTKCEREANEARISALLSIPPNVVFCASRAGAQVSLNPPQGNCFGRGEPQRRGERGGAGSEPGSAASSRTTEPRRRGVAPLYCNDRESNLRTTILSPAPAPRAPTHVRFGRAKAVVHESHRP
jgi:hypothetical protein